jgi:hypothetical protein
MEQSATPSLRLNWRFQQGVFRAAYDAYVKSRLEYETGLEAEAWSVLRSAGRTGSVAAMQAAKTVLDRAIAAPVSDDLRSRLFDLAEALFQSIRMQLHSGKYKAGRPDGAVLDRVDMPLNNRPWLLARFEAIAALGGEEERLDEIQKLVRWTDPGPGGFYDDLGDPNNQPHLEPGTGFIHDPYFYSTPLVFPDASSRRGISMYPVSWRTTVLGLYDQPIRLVYSKLDPHAAYRVRAVYTDGPVRLVADGTQEIHPLLNERYQAVEFDIPVSLTADGRLTLAWTRTPGEGGSGRGNQIAEVWLVRK